MAAEPRSPSTPAPLSVAATASRLLPAFAVAALVLVALLLLPLGVLLAANTPAQLVQTLSEPEVLAAFTFTATAALAATGIALLLGLPLAYLLARSRAPWARWLEALLELPLVLPHTAAGLALLLAFSRRSPAGAILEHLGLGIVNHPLGTVLAMTFVSAPYLVGAAREAFARVDRRLEQVARTLGASPWYTVRRVTLPLAAPGIVAGAAQMWARGVSEFGAIMIVAYHPQVVSVLLWDRFETGGLRAVTPLAALTVLAALVLLVLARLFAARLPETGRRR